MSTVRARTGWGPASNAAGGRTTNAGHRCRVSIPAASAGWARASRVTAAPTTFAGPSCSASTEHARLRAGRRTCVAASSRWRERRGRSAWHRDVRLGGPPRQRNHSENEGAWSPQAATGFFMVGGGGRATPRPYLRLCAELCSELDSNKHTEKMLLFSSWPISQYYQMATCVPPTPGQRVYT